MSASSPRIDSLAGPPGLRFIQIDYAADASMPPHSHEGETTFNYCLSGSLLELRDRQEFRQETASISLLPAGTLHANRFRAGARVFLVVLGAEWRERVRPVSSVLDGQPLTSRGGVSSWIAARLHREFLRRDALTPLALEGMVLELVAELSREFSREDAPRWLRETIDFLYANFAQSLSAEEIAAASGIHPSHLMRAFRQRHRCTVGEYVRRLRVERASHLLETSETPLAEVAREVGFCDQAHLGRAFKEHVGLTPGQFRRVHGRSSSLQKMHS
jgi:AraC family transcriptional regulator